MQVPASFAYAKATSVEHALALLAEHGEEARVIAGGHSLLPMMKLRLAKPDALIDINGLTDLAYLRLDGDVLAIGALTRHAALLSSPLVAEHFPILIDAERVIADPVVRNWGTIGGSLCQADPAEDMPAALVAVNASVVVRGPAGERVVPLREFHTGPYETVVAPGELMTAVRLPIRPGGSSAYEKVERRAGDWAVAAAGAAVWLTSGVVGWTVDDAGIGLTAVGAEHYSAPQAEAFLRGKLATPENVAEAGRIAGQHCEPAADQR
jgi:carbon-monoxide dehydrogenase medium subunit